MKFFYLFILVFLTPFFALSQNNAVRVNFNEEGTHYFRATFTNQVWLRYNQSNPGTLVFGEQADETFDIGLRRTRIQMFGQLTDHVFFYFQFGQNNFNFTSPKYTGAFFHDALGEYHVFGNDLLKLGAGLTIASGPSRYSQASIGTSLGLDLPVYQQATTGVIDQFTRKLSVYARGQVLKLDYRFLITDPFGPTEFSLGTDAEFASVGHSKQYHGYVFYQFFEKESNTTPAMTGTYLGTKKVFNIGGGFVYQNDAMWSRAGVNSDTAYHDLALFAVDAFLDLPMSNGSALTAYASYSNNNYGPNYLRNVGVMNPATGETGNVALNGPGNAFPMMGTGHAYFVQAGYLLPPFFSEQETGNIQPYGNLLVGDYEALAEPAMTWNIGVNYYLNGHRSKFSLDYQNRPIYYDMPGGAEQTARRGMLVLQYQINL